MSSGHDSTPPPWLSLPRLGLILGLVLLALWRFTIDQPDGNIDDAFILLVYARHFAQSGQFYYNIADGRIDGFTSPLDLWIKGIIIRIVPADPILIIWLLTIVLYLAIVLSGLYFANRFKRTNRGSFLLAALFGVLLATNQGLAAGSQFLLETPLYVLLGIWTIYYFVVEKPPKTPRQLVVFGLLLLALPLTRPEGLVVSAASYACFLYTEHRGQKRASLLAPGMLLLLGLAAYYTWRVRYFGYWAPNTYYAKTSESRLVEIQDGAHYVIKYLLSPAFPVMAWLLASPLWARCFAQPEARRRYLMLCFVMLASLAAVVYAGGDCYGGGRFLALPLVLALLLLLRVLTELPPSGWRRVAHGLALCMIVVQLGELLVVPAYFLWTAPRKLRQALKDKWPLTERSFACDAEFARRLARLVGPQGPGARIVAQTDFQRMKYFADDVHTVDLSGLNDRGIAHRPVAGQVLYGKGSYTDALARRPAVWIVGHRVGPRWAPPQPMAAASLRAVFDAPAVAESYFGYAMEPPFIVPISAAYTSASLGVCQGYYNFLLRNDLIDEARQQGFLVGPPSPTR